MSCPHKINTIVWPMLMLLLSSAAWAQDPSEADTVRLISISDQITNKIAMPVWLFNDEELTSIVIPLVIDGYSGWVRFDSVSYLGSRLADPQILDAREGFVFATDTFSVASLVLRFMVSAGNALPAGSGKLCDLWFTPLFGGQVSLDTLPVSPYGGLQLTWTSPQEVFIPQFAAGTIDIACDYTVGDTRNDGGVNIGDYLGLQKGYHGCQTWDGGPPYVADVNCDRHADMRDARHLLRHAMLGGTICSCGSYTPAVYDDPGLPDTLWIENDTLMLGVAATIDVGIINDEPIYSLALGLEWDGSANMQLGWPLNITDRVNQILDLDPYDCHYHDGVNPDILYMFTMGQGDMGGEAAPIAPGSGAIFRAPFIPLSLGTATFRLVKFPKGSESMLVTESESAILPVLVGGQITVIPRPCGDANKDGLVNIGDAVYIVNYVFKGGPAPDPIESGDANCDLAVNIGDAVYIINYVFKGGPAPCCP